ncbi:hypothetical protein DN550_34790, partial [Burkholderia multivorans]
TQQPRICIRTILLFDSSTVRSPAIQSFASTDNLLIRHLRGQGLTACPSKLWQEILLDSSG